MSASDPAPSQKSGGVMARLADRLGATRRGLAQGLAGLVGLNRKIDAALLEELEALLLGADVGVPATQAILADLDERVRRHRLDGADALYAALRQAMLEIVQPCARPLDIGAARPFVIMVVGVNGAGKTTTIGKLAHHISSQGHSVLLGAGDTFRAAAVEQLKTWGERNAVPVVAQASGADSAAVAHDAMQAAAARGSEVLIFDTAGRLHTQTGLMDELKKIKRVFGRFDAGAPHEVLLVLDAGIGQNALAQLEHFNAAVGVTGLVLTKLDGTAKGGVLLALARKARLPIRYIGVGEGIEDLHAFDAEQFVDALIKQ